MAMSKVLSWVFIILGLGVLVAGTSPRLYNMIHEQKRGDRNHSWWGEHNSPYGDLVSMAYLDDITTFRSPKDYQFTTAVYNGRRNIDLYVWGDSYLEEVPGKVFSHVNKYQFGRTYFGNLHYTLDTKKRNILIIEASERFFRPYFSYKSIYSSVCKDTIRTPITTAAPVVMPDINDLFNSHINQNIEYLAFNYNFLNKPRQWKADINYLLFDRASGNVTISDDHRNLFIKQTVLPKHGYSCYEVLPDNTVHWFVTSVNEVYDHYRQEGFDEVYLSIIPAPVSVLQPDRYNKLIPRLRADTSLRMPLLDVYPEYIQAADPHTLYRAGDSHWNNKGFQVWLGMVNEMLTKQSQQ